ncbi:hypothetical protein GL218_04933 [Daldinia childiae]|uniref:uncharacterized protein n=1 Tax=Daldinia childiae TaxID=326645 RepID=UPI001446D182|nr:uncharacterized protein GL218_04933 [Daldinia childiae]KAF3059409.1 hypothetical protein GL218_04933 [Daldinia childiae]
METGLDAVCEDVNLFEAEVRDYLKNHNKIKGVNPEFVASRAGSMEDTAFQPMLDLVLSITGSFETLRNLSPQKSSSLLCLENSVLAKRLKIAQDKLCIVRDKMEDKYERACADRDENQDRFDQLQENLDNLEASSSPNIIMFEATKANLEAQTRLEQSEADLKEETKKLKESETKLKQNIQNIGNNESQLKEKVRKLSDKVEALEENKVLLQKQGNTLVDTTNRLRDEKKSLKQSEAQLIQEKSQLVTDHAASVTELKDQIASLELRLRILQDATDKYKRDLDQEKTLSTVTLYDKNTEAEYDILDANKEIERLEKQISEGKENLEKMRGDIDRAESRANGVQKPLDSVQRVLGEERLAAARAFASYSLVSAVNYEFWLEFASAQQDSVSIEPVDRQLGHEEPRPWIVLQTWFPANLPPFISKPGLSHVPTLVSHLYGEITTKRRTNLSISLNGSLTESLTTETRVRDASLRHLVEKAIETHPTYHDLPTDLFAIAVWQLVLLLKARWGIDIGESPLTKLKVYLQRSPCRPIYDALGRGSGNQGMLTACQQHGHVFGDTGIALLKLPKLVDYVIVVHICDKLLRAVSTSRSDFSSTDYGS